MPTDLERLTELTAQLREHAAADRHPPVRLVNEAVVLLAALALESRQ